MWHTVVSHVDNNLYNCFLSILILKIGAIIQTMKEVLCFRTTYISYTQWHIYVFGAWNDSLQRPPRNYELNFATLWLCHLRPMPLCHCFTCTIFTKVHSRIINRNATTQNLKVWEHKILICMCYKWFVFRLTTQVKITFCYKAQTARIMHSLITSSSK